MTDQQLQLALAKMLPEKIKMAELWDGVAGQTVYSFIWYDNSSHVLDTEWLHVCRLVEQDLRFEQHQAFRSQLWLDTDTGQDISASWQQRARALIAIKEATT